MKCKHSSRDDEEPADIAGENRVNKIHLPIVIRERCVVTNRKIRNGTNDPRISGSSE